MQTNYKICRKYYKKLAQLCLSIRSAYKDTQLRAQHSLIKFLIQSMIELNTAGKGNETALFFLFSSVVFILCYGLKRSARGGLGPMLRYATQI